MAGQRKLAKGVWWRKHLGTVALVLSLIVAGMVLGPGAGGVGANTKEVSDGQSERDAGSRKLV